MESQRINPRTVFRVAKLPDLLTLSTRLLLNGGKVTFVLEDGASLNSEKEYWNQTANLLSPQIITAVRPFYRSSLMETTIPDACLMTKDIGRTDTAMYGWIDCAGETGVFCLADSPFKKGLLFYLFFSEGYGWKDKNEIGPKHPRFAFESLRDMVFGIAVKHADANEKSPDLGLGEFITLAFHKALEKQAESKLLWQLLTCIRDTSFEKQVWQTSAKAIVPWISAWDLSGVNSVQLLLVQAILEKASKSFLDIIQVFRNRLNEIDPDKCLKGPAIDILR